MVVVVNQTRVVQAAHCHGSHAHGQENEVQRGFDTLRREPRKSHRERRTCGTRSGELGGKGKADLGFSRERPLIESWFPIPPQELGWSG